MPTLTQILVEPKDRSTLLSELRTYLKTRREEIRSLHRGGYSGHHILIRLTALVDMLISEVYQRELTRFEREHGRSIRQGYAVIAVGGYGRGELNPYSDIDILFLYRPEFREAVECVAMEVLYLLWDLQFTIGHSSRTISECIRIAQSDITAKTAMMEARLLTGSEELFEDFQKTFRSRVLPKRVEDYIEEKRREMRQRHFQFGSSIYLVEPNVKESPGGLRDVHFLQWIAMARYGLSTPAELHRRGHLTPREYREITRAQDFLWRVRNEMHFHAGRASDVLTFDEQKRLADFFNYPDEPHRLGVERFMRRYYISATRIHDISGRFIEKATPLSWKRRIVDTLLSRRVGSFTLTRHAIRISERRKSSFPKDGGELMNLFYLAQLHGLKISTDTMDLIHASKERIPKDLRVSPEANRLFHAVMSWPNGAADTLRLLHRLRILRKIIPEFAKVDRMVQYDRYHKYTVDEHTFRAVGKAQELYDGSDTVARTYQEIKRKDILLLGLLLHDIGKGSKEDHSVVGARVAERLSRQLGFPDQDRNLLIFLVRHHLVMSHIAFRRDLSDDKVIVLFARQVARPEVLKKLFVLTYADIRAVGPDTWTEWKKNLLTELFCRTLEELTGTRAAVSVEERIRRLKKEIEGKFCLLLPAEWFDEALNDMESRYLLVTPSDKIIHHLQRIYQLTQGEKVLVDTVSDAVLTEFTIYTYDDVAPGLFSKIAGVLAAIGYNILGAQVYTSRKGIVVDTFQAQDPFPEEKSAVARRESVQEYIRKVLTHEVTVESLFEKRSFRRPAEKIISREPAVVEIDNESSDGYSIIDIFAPDKQGLLYVITKTIYDLGLSVHSSKIATKVDQIVDVFYVKDRQGDKVLDPDRVEEIRKRLIQEIEIY